MRSVILSCLSALALMSAAPAHSAGLCDLEVGGYSNLLNPDAGYFQNPTFAIEPGYDGMRLEARLLTPKADPEWKPVVKLYAMGKDGDSYALRYGMDSVEATEMNVAVITYHGEDEPARDEAGKQPVAQSIRADIHWDGAGNVTFTSYQTDKGFWGPGVSRTVHTGDLKEVSLLVTTADVDVTSLRYGRNCPVT